MQVSLYGAGTVSTNCAKILARRPGVTVLGPYGREERERALTSGADVVVIATSSFLSVVAPDIRLALESGSNVLTTAEEAAFPAAIDAAIAQELDAVAREHGVTVLASGLNPGFCFDALVLTATGVAWEVDTIRVERCVQLAGFSESILRRLGLGWTAEEFAERVASGAITGHVGFPQSMRIVAQALGVALERVERTIEPILGDRDYPGEHYTAPSGTSAGFVQHYRGIADRREWFEAKMIAHMDLAAAGKAPRDEIWLQGPTPVHLCIDPGLNPQIGSAAMVVNSLRTLVAGPPGWVLIGDLPPATAA